ncbi:MAG: 30S ribosomal protein S6--L-glutamate ligase [Algoriphagus sp.]|jgi:ribosomal protein S6--L-glutamate ligase|uniref:30S ribosomal protein S6--L-glutamate ligase n=2 Tax=Algoriphagus sp. TaxID=1872435 RepID=UPI002745E910|nr:30S ribosomal protein S6--L-glutamate ligase [Algoriphagus sp.]MDP4748871.1 30S ribosomal protein S6--L-glutamate ligase [Algoriphagus sp.]MDP4839543.1 30S ribosomal protein S6--L-glutamate ligase [Algoriphagus sp.]MDP4905292.1 30S ribosomal protein S6--L-glutamate ligase [Algoriphagus sp.]MDP4957608.1 30S ribosomal protein S6--L-glutamate ligase [Algoriphagus sp.]
MKIAVLSRNPKLFSTQRLLEEIEKAGHESLVVDHSLCDLIIEQEGPSIIYKGHRLEGVDAIIPRIGASVTFYGTAVVRQFELMGAFSAVTSQAIVRSRDKLRSLQILSKNGLGMPKTAFTNFSKGGEKQLIEQVSGAPVIIKLLEGTQGLGVVLAETKKAAQSVVEAFHGLKARIIVQEYIKEAKGADIRAFVVHGKVVGAMKRQGAEGEFRSNLHRGGVATVIKLSRLERQAALNAAKALGLDVAGVDMLQSDRGPLILEVNSSPGLEGIEGATGINIAAEIVNFVVDSVLKKSSKRENQ